MTWHLATVDPFTGKLPEDPFKGFLPPNEDGTEGQGVVFYDVAFKNPTNGAKIENVADIVFDLNEPIRTNTWSNLIDTDTPTASLTAPANTTSPKFEVTWGGADATSGVAQVDVYVSKDGGAYEIWQAGVAPGSGDYEGEAGHTYAFSAVVRDWAGNASLLPPAPHATTTVAEPVKTFERTGKITVTGTPKVGQVLTVSEQPTWTPAADELKLEWLRDGVPIADATGTSYTLVAADEGKPVSVRLTASKTGYTDDVVTSEQQTVAKADPPKTDPTPAPQGDSAACTAAKQAASASAGQVDAASKKVAKAKAKVKKLKKAKAPAAKQKKAKVKLSKAKKALGDANAANSTAQSAVGASCG